MKIKKRKIYYSFIVLLAVFLWILWGNNSIKTTNISVSFDNLPKSFSGFKILHISDLHNAEFGNDNEKLISKISETNADIAVITGDLIDRNHTSIETALTFTKKLTEIMPVYYVTGNHEASCKDYALLEQGLIENGVIVLRNGTTEITKNNDTIEIIGIDDPNFSDMLFFDQEAIVNETLKNIIQNNDSFKILLSHRPELFETYVSNNIDIVLSGHAHGGQVRLPFIGGVVAPNQGFFPLYDAGLYSENNTNMVVSRGLGNSIIPVRINNRPEIVVVELINEN